MLKSLGNIGEIDVLVRPLDTKSREDAALLQALPFNPWDNVSIQDVATLMASPPAGTSLQLRLTQSTSPASGTTRALPNNNNNNHISLVRGHDTASISDKAKPKLRKILQNPNSFVYTLNDSIAQALNSNPAANAAVPSSATNPSPTPSSASSSAPASPTKEQIVQAKIKAIENNNTAIIRELGNFYYPSNEYYFEETEAFKGLVFHFVQHLYENDVSREALLRSHMNKAVAIISYKEEDYLASQQAANLATVLSILPTTDNEILITSAKKTPDPLVVATLNERRSDLVDGLLIHQPSRYLLSQYQSLFQSGSPISPRDVKGKKPTLDAEADRCKHDEHNKANRFLTPISVNCEIPFQYDCTLSAFDNYLALKTLLDNDIAVKETNLKSKKRDYSRSAPNIARIKNATHKITEQAAIEAEFNAQHTEAKKKIDTLMTNRQTLSNFTQQLYPSIQVIERAVQLKEKYAQLGVGLKQEREKPVAGSCLSFAPLEITLSSGILYECLVALSGTEKDLNKRQINPHQIIGDYARNNSLCTIQGITFTYHYVPESDAELSLVMVQLGKVLTGSDKPVETQDEYVQFALPENPGKPCAEKRLITALEKTYRQYADAKVKILGCYNIELATDAVPLNAGNPTIPRTNASSSSSSASTGSSITNNDDKFVVLLDRRQEALTFKFIKCCKDCQAHKPAVTALLMDAKKKYKTN